MIEDQVKERALEIIAGLEAAIQNAAAQLPVIADEYILYGRVYYTTIFAILCVVGICNAIISLRTVYIVTGPVNSESEIKFAAFMLSTIATIICIISAMMCFKNFIMVWTASRIWLLIEIHRIFIK